MGKLLVFGLGLLVIGGALWLVAPDNFVENCPLFGIGTLASACDDAIAAEQARRDAEFGLKDFAGLMGGVGAALSGLAMVVGLFRRAQ